MGAYASEARTGSRDSDEQSSSSHRQDDRLPNSPAASQSIPEYLRTIGPEQDEQEEGYQNGIGGDVSSLARDHLLEPDVYSRHPATFAAEREAETGQLDSQSVLEEEQISSRTDSGAGDTRDSTDGLTGQFDELAQSENHGGLPSQSIADWQRALRDARAIPGRAPSHSESSQALDSREDRASPSSDTLTHRGPRETPQREGMFGQDLSEHSGSEITEEEETGSREADEGEGQSAAEDQAAQAQESETEADSEDQESGAEAGEDAEAESGDGGPNEADGGGAPGESGSDESDILDDLETGEALVDFELAEHERWAGSFGEMGTAGTDQRAQFILDQAGQGTTSGATGALGMGFVMGAIGAGVGQIAGRRLATLAVSRGFAATPVPGLGSAIGGVMAVAGLAMRDWGATAETIGRMGEGEGYEGLANDLEGLAEILDIATQVMDVLAGVLGGIAVGMWVAAVLSAGTLSPLAASLSAIALGINAATTAIGILISVVIRPVVVALRALHTFESQGDPAQIEAEGQQLQSAAGQITGAVAGAAAGRLGGAAGTRGGTRVDAGISRIQAGRTGGSPSMSARGSGPRIHAEVPEAPSGPTRPTPASTATAAPAAGSGPRAASPSSRSGSTSDTAPIRMDVLEEFGDAQRLASGAPLGQPELGNLPGPPTGRLRRGERDPGNYVVPPAARSRVGREGREAGMGALTEAVQSGIDTPRTAASRETIPSDTLVALTDPDYRPPESRRRRGATESSEPGTEMTSYQQELGLDAERSVQASHVPGVATEPHDAHRASGVEILRTADHIEGIHGSVTSRPLETAFPNPDYQGRPGFSDLPQRAPSSTRTDRGHLQGAARDLARRRRDASPAEQVQIDAALAWLQRRSDALGAFGGDDLTPPAASSPVARSSSAPTSSIPSHTQTVRTPDRAAAMEQYHQQIAADPGRESGVWRGEDGTFYVMQGDSGSVAPPAGAGRAELIYHSHPTTSDVGYQGMVSQPSQAGGDFGVLQFQHGQGTPGSRQSSELHFPVYDDAGNHTGYGATQFAYDPTHPLPLQVQTTTPGGRPTTQRYASHADFEARTGIGASGSTPAATRSTADTQLQTDVAAARSRIDTIAGDTRTRAYGLPGMSLGAELGRQEVHEDVDVATGGELPVEGESAGGDTGRPQHGPAYTGSVEGLEPGASFEIPINPAYPEPPGTPAELAVLMERVHAAQAAQEDLSGTEEAMQGQAAEQQTHATQLGEAQVVTQDLTTGRQAHQGQVDTTQSTNAEQQSTAGEAISNLGQAAEQATALATLTASLGVFQGLAHLFSYLPGALGRSAEGAKEDAGGLINSLNRVSETEATESNIETGRGGMEVNEERITGVATAGQQTDEELASGEAGVVELQQANTESLTETQSVLGQANRERSAAEEIEDEAQSTHDNLESSLQAWAQEHQQAREDAIASAMDQYSEQGYEVREE